MQFNSIDSGRILPDVPCRVCQDHSSGKHYGIFSCDGCAGFFKRSIRRHRQYVCKNKGGCDEGRLLLGKNRRRTPSYSSACRLRKCLEIGMNKEAVQHERGPRNSSLRRQNLLMEHPRLALSVSRGFLAGRAMNREIPSASTGPMDGVKPSVTAFLTLFQRAKMAPSSANDVP
ncbi:unnamed protein product [Heligmosomoides polygyrus]|uniref:Nuclear receptor domain-containing protein n=1 Tax=Heligmosomoides polygyrus TaxID=6339 RepID=A0A183G1N2_HELPZ|nr:unnamed protein product [Heligmosomoides polygyrus]